jgi:phosphoserine phosphatase
MPIYALVLTSPPNTPSLSDFAVDRAWQMIPEAQRRQRHWLAPREAWEGLFATNEVGVAPALRQAVRDHLHGITLDVNVVTAEPATRRKKLLVADMDSTIIQQECIDEMADMMGLKPHIAKITERAMRGELVFESALRERVALLKGLPVSDLERVYDERINLMPGARVLTATMRKAGAHAALVSGGFTYFTSRVADAAGFDTNHANTLEIANGKLTGRVVEPILGRQAKLDQLVGHQSRLGLERALTMAVGDGANDLEMVKAAGLGVAFRAKPIVSAEADAAIDHGDLTALLYLQGYGKDEFAAA